MREEEKKGYERVEEPLVLTAGEVIEVVLDSCNLIVWTSKLCLCVSTWYCRGPATNSFKMNLRSC
jgi:hypothetical protein